MKSIRSLSILLFLLSFTACSTFKYTRLATEYSRRSPLAEAESDYGARDYEIYSAMGIGHYYPGLSHDQGKRIAAEHGEKMLPGTTDAPESRAQANYIGVATRFASTYNKRKASLLTRNAR